MRRSCTALTFFSLIFVSISLSAGGQETSATGSRLASATDLEVAAGSIPLRLQRTPTPGQTERRALGTRWRHNWEGRLSRTGGQVRIDNWDGVTVFTPVGQNRGGQSLEHESTSGERVTFMKDGRAVRRTPDGLSETFDAAGRLIERIYHQGSKFLLRYDAQGRLSRVEGPSGSFLAFTADQAGRAIRAESSTGAAVHYAYAKDDLTEVQINGGFPLRYGYDVEGALVRIEDPQTGPLEITYESKGRVASYRWADGSEQRFEYDDAGNTRKTIEPDGAITVTQDIPEKRRTEVTDPLGHKSTIQSDQGGRPMVVSGPTGASSRLNYDSFGRIVAAEDALGHSTRYEYAGDNSTVKAIIHPDGTRQEFEYDDGSNLTAIKVDGKIVSALTYNPDGGIATAKEPGAKERKFTYYPSGLVKSVANALGEATQFEYDSRGNLARETNPLGGVTVRAYDSQDRLVSLTNPAGETISYGYDPRGRLIRRTDAAGRATNFEYDARGRLASESDPSGQVTRYEYTPTGKIAKVIGPSNQAESYSYDLAGNLTARTDRLGRTLMLDYDPAGRVIRERWPTGLEVRYGYDVAGNLFAVEDSGGAKSDYQVDVSGLVTARTNPAGGKTQYQYDRLGNLLAVTDPAGRVKQFGHTAEGDLAEAGEPSRDLARYEYDAAGRMVAIRRPSGGVSRFTYDRMGNLLTATDPLGNVKRYSYDNAGRLLSFTDAANRVTRYGHDKAGRRVEKQLPDGKRVAFKYDVLGKLIEADDSKFPIRMSYDEAGRLKRVEYAAINKYVAYEYDAQGLRTRMIGPDGRETRYEYDALKRVSAVVAPDGRRITLGYDQHNRVQSTTYPNGLTGRWDYDGSGQIAKISYLDKSGKAVAGSAYRYDSAGNPVERQDAQGQTSRFSYDAAGQLLKETNADGATTYAYVAGGNRTTVEAAGRVKQYKHDAADRLIQAGTEQLSYDVNGNLTSRKGPGGVTAYEYDGENHLVKVVTPEGATIELGYAPTGERVWRRDKSGTTYFFYDGIDLIAELDKDLRTKKSLVYGYGIDRPVALLQGKESYYYLTDRIGSVTHLTDDKGNVVAAYTYDAFGKTRARQGTVANPFAYTGRELDPTGLYYYRSRYYDPELGRFLSQDVVTAKLDEPLEQNPYVYARNNPVRFVDPFGLDYFTPEYLAGQSTDDLLHLIQAESNQAGQQQIYDMLRGRGVSWPNADARFGYNGPYPPPSQSMPSSNVGPAALPQQIVGRPGGGGPAIVNPGETGRLPGIPQDVVGRPGQAGPVNPNPQPTGSFRPVGAGDGNTLRDAAPGVSGGGGGRGFWSLDPASVRPSIRGFGAGASILSGLVNCVRNGVSQCGPRIVIGGAVAAVLARAGLGPVGTLIAGGMAWWQIGKEGLQRRADKQQRDEQERAREAQEQENLKHPAAFYIRIEQLRVKINRLNKDHIIANQNPPKAKAQADIAKAAALAAEHKLNDSREVKQKKAALISELCADLSAKIDKSDPASIKREIEGVAGQTEAKQGEIDRLLSEGKQLAANCQSAEDAQAVKGQYNSIKSLLQQMDQSKRAADLKNASLEQTRQLIENFKGRVPAKITTNIADRSFEADNAAKEAERLVTEVRDATEKLEAGKKQLRIEINALQGATPAALLVQLQPKFDELHALLTAVTQYPPLVRYDDQALDDAKRVRLYKDEALRIVETWDVKFPCNTDIPSADAAIQRIDTALTMAGLNDTADLLHRAQACEASVKCIPAINQARELIQRLEIEQGEAAINQVRQQGCNVEGLQNTLDYYRSVRDAAALLFNAKEQCKFEEGVAFAEKMPASIQNNPWIANGIGEVRAGAAARRQMEQFITQATEAADAASSLNLHHNYEAARKKFAQADAFLAQADGVAAPYPCLVDRVNRYKSEYNKLKVSANRVSGGRLSGPDQLPTDELPEALSNAGKAAAAGTGVIVAAPTDEVPAALDPGRPSKQQPNDQLPSTLAGIGSQSRQPTGDVPAALDPSRAHAPAPSRATQQTNQPARASGSSGVPASGAARTASTPAVGSSQQAANWNGTWSDGVTTATLSGGANSLSGSWTYRSGDSSGSASLSACRVNQTVASCSMSGSHQDSTKNGTRTGTMLLTLSGNSLAFRYTEGAEPSWSYKPGYSKDNVSSSMHKGATFTGSLTRK